MYPRNTRNTRKEIHVCAIPRRLEIQQEITEKTEDRSNLCSLRCLLFKSPSVARSCRTSRLTDPAPVTTGIRLRRNCGVRCSRFVRRNGHEENHRIKTTQAKYADTRLKTTQSQPIAVAATPSTLRTRGILIT